MSPRTATPLNIRQPLLGPAANSVIRTAEPRYKTDMCDQYQEPGPDEALIPVDAARTVSDAARAAAQIAAHLDRPAILPRTDSTTVLTDDSFFRVGQLHKIA